MKSYIYNLEKINIIRKNKKAFLKLEGWVLHNSNNSKLIVEIDKKRFELDFNKYREDVNDSYKIYEKSNLGFDYEFEVSNFNNLSLKIFDENLEVLLKRLNYNSIGCVNENLQFNLENIMFKDLINKIEVTLSGWVVDENVDNKLKLIIKNEAGRIIYENFTDIVREDVMNLYERGRVNKEVGFNITFKLGKKNGKIKICVKEDNSIFEVTNINIPQYESINRVRRIINIMKINLSIIKKGMLILRHKKISYINVSEYIQKYKNNFNKEYSKFKNMNFYYGDVNPYKNWVKNNQISEKDYNFMEEDIKKFKYKPKISILMPIWNVEKKWLDKAVNSIKNQCYKNWEICMVDDKSTKSYIRPYLQELIQQEERIKIKFREKNGNISECTNTAFGISTGEYILLMDNDDELTPNALYEIIKCLQVENRPDIIYSDDDKIDEDGKRYAPQFKPDWSPELLLSFMYFSHIFCFSREMYIRAGGCRIGFEGCQDYDLALRMTELTNNIKHIDKILYHWRSIKGSTALDGNAKPEAFDRGIKAVKEALDRRGINGKVVRPDYAIKSNLGIFSIEFPENGPEVSIIIPTKNQKKLLKRCIDSIVNNTKYSNYKIVVINNDSDEHETIEYLNELRSKHIVLDIHNKNNKFSYAYINNKAVSMTKSEYVLFLNNDTEVISGEWLSNMIGYSQIEGVGIVGARLLFPDNRVQHAGVVLGLYNGMVAPTFKLLPNYSLGYFNFAKVTRNYSCVTAACMLIKRNLFNELKGFDEEKFAVAYNDVDLCIRCINKGKRIVYAAEAELYHYEGASRGFVDNIDEILNYKKLYGGYIDKFYNKNLSMYDEQFEINSENTLEYNNSIEDKKILFCTHNLNLEGAPLHLYEIVKGIKATAKNSTSIIISPKDGPLKQMYENIGVEVKIIEYNPFLSLYKDDYDKYVNKLTQYIKSKECDFIYANTLETFPFIDIANNINVPSIWNIHESVDYKTYFTGVDNYVQKKYLDCFINATKVIFVCDATLRMYNEMNLVNNFDYIYNGIDKKPIDEYKNILSKKDAKLKLNISEKTKLITIVGTVCERKGQLDFVNMAINIIKESDDDIKFCIVGCRAGVYLEKIKNVISSNNVQDKFLLINETKEVNLYYRASDIFVCASYNESFPRVTLEAMAFGLPIVTTNVFGLKEQVRENVNGLYFNPGDVPKLKDNIIKLTSNNDIYEKFSINSQKVLKMLNSHDEMIEKYINIIKHNIK